MFLPCRPEWVLTHHTGQFPSRGSVRRSEYRTPLHCRRLPQPHCALAERWPAPTVRCPLDTAFDRVDHQWPKAGGQWQLRMRGHQQFRLKGSVGTASRYRCANIMTHNHRNNLRGSHTVFSDGHIHSPSAFWFRGTSSVLVTNMVRCMMPRHIRSQRERQGNNSLRLSLQHSCQHNLPSETEGEEESGEDGDKEEGVIQGTPRQYRNDIIYNVITR